MKSALVSPPSNPGQVTLRSADGKEFNISRQSLTPEDSAYLESIQATGH
jgi:hypothetical protein